MARATLAPIDPETGVPVRNWPTHKQLNRRKKGAADDKDASGEWTTAAILRLGGCLRCRTVFHDECDCFGAER